MGSFGRTAGVPDESPDTDAEQRIGRPCGGRLSDHGVTVCFRGSYVLRCGARGRGCPGRSHRAGGLDEYQGAGRRPLSARVRADPGGEAGALGLPDTVQEPAAERG